MMACFDFASEAKHRVTISQEVQVDDGLGGFTITFADVGTYWAIIKPLSVSETFLSEKMQSKVSHKITIRYQTDLKDTAITGAYKLKFDGRTFSIKGVINLSHDLKAEGKDYQRLMVVENGAVSS